MKNPFKQIGKSVAENIFSFEASDNSVFSVITEVVDDSDQVRLEQTFRLEDGPITSSITLFKECFTPYLLRRWADELEKTIEKGMIKQEKAEEERLALEEKK